MSDGAATRKEMYSELRRSLPAQLPVFLREKRWFGGKAREIRSTAIADLIPVNASDLAAVIVMTQVNYGDGSQDMYALPLVFAEASNKGMGRDGDVLRARNPATGKEAFLRDGLKDTRFLNVLLSVIRERTVLAGERGELRASQTRAFRQICPDSSISLEPKPIGTEQSNSSIVYGELAILKFFRRIEEGINPELELGLFLTENGHFSHTPQLAGSLEYRASGGRSMTQGILQAFVANQTDAWRYTLNCVSTFYESILANPTDSAWEGKIPDIQANELSANARTALHEYLASAGLLGKRTAELHRALASTSDEPAFAPESFSDSFRRRLQDSFVAMTAQIVALLRGKLSELPPEWRAEAKSVASREKEMVQRCEAALSQSIEAMRIRIHGDYHLGQILHTETDFVIIDFEGEPARSLAERREKRSAMQDVAGMLRSFQYAAFAPLLGGPGKRPSLYANAASLRNWGEWWSARAAERFLTAYFETSDGAVYLPRKSEERRILLEFHLLEKAIYELGYELNNRPDWVGIPLAGILSLLTA